MALPRSKVHRFQLKDCPNVDLALAESCCEASIKPESSKTMFQIFDPQKYYLILSIALLTIFQGCYTAEMAQNPDGSWYETGRQVLNLPAVEHIRDYKDIKFPGAFQKQLVDYRNALGM